MPKKLRMPIGKYEGKPIEELPRSYVMGFIKDADEKSLIKIIGKQRYNAMKRIVDRRHHE